MVIEALEHAMNAEERTLLGLEAEPPGKTVSVGDGPSRL